MAQWKAVQVIFLLKPGKPHNVLTSYQPISLLIIVSEVFEKLLLKKFMKMVENDDLYQIIGLASERGTPQQNKHIELYNG
jgi:hypothetical protein